MKTYTENIKKTKFKSYKKNDPSKLLIAFFDYSICFLVYNLLFILTNIPFTFLFLFVRLDFNSIFFIFLSLCITGPSITALLASMGRIIRDKNFGVYKYYFRYYKMNFKQSLTLWMSFLIPIFILIYNINFCMINDSLQLFVFPLLMLVVFTVTLGVNAFVILTRFSMTNAMIIKTAFYYMIKKFYVSLLYIVIFLVSYLLFLYGPSIIILLASSLTCYCIMFVSRTMLRDIEIKSKFIGDEISEEEIVV